MTVERDFEERLASLAAQIKKQQNEAAKLRRTFEDMIYNLDTENMPEVAALISKYRNESREAFARLEARADESGERLSLLVGEDGEVDGAVIVSAINGQSEVSIDADRIDLNGAVTANEKFKIKTDGGVECKDLALTGGSIRIPCEPGRVEPVLSAGDESSGLFSGIYSDRVYVGRAENIATGVGESSEVFANLVRCVEADDYSDGRAVRVGSLDCDSVVLTRRHYGADGEPLESADDAGVQITPDGIVCKAIYQRTPPESGMAAMKSLYIDSMGTIWAW